MIKPKKENLSGVIHVTDKDKNMHTLNYIYENGVLVSDSLHKYYDSDITWNIKFQYAHKDNLNQGKTK